jgi:hypothetical protein
MVLRNGPGENGWIGWIETLRDGWFEAYGDEVIEVSLNECSCPIPKS